MTSLEFDPIPPPLRKLVKQGGLVRENTVPKHSAAFRGVRIAILPYHKWCLKMEPGGLVFVRDCSLSAAVGDLQKSRNAWSLCPETTASNSD